MRYNIELPKEHVETDEEYIIKNVKILAEGTWNRVQYLSEDLRRATFRDNVLYSRHYSGEERNESEIIGFISEKQFIDNAIVGDVHIDKIKGADTIDNILSGNITGLSVEHISNDILLDGQATATSIQILGTAAVKTPACKVCTLSEKEEPKKELETMTEDMDKIQELTDQIAELSDKVSELQKVDIDAVVTEQARKDTKVISELSARIEELEQEPVQNTMVASTDVENRYAGIVSKSGEVYTA